MTAFHHAVGEARAILRPAQEPASLLEPDVELLEVARGELCQRDMAQLRDDVLVDAIFVISLGLGTGRGLAVILIPMVQPHTEGYVRLGALQFSTLEAGPQLSPASSRSRMAGPAVA